MRAYPGSDQKEVRRKRKQNQVRNTTGGPGAEGKKKTHRTDPSTKGGRKKKTHFLPVSFQDERMDVEVTSGK